MRPATRRRFDAVGEGNWQGDSSGMARWPRHFWTTLFTYGTIFLLFPLLGFLAYAWIRGWLF
jgi:hypothetical protein